MLIPYERPMFICEKPVDFRMGIDALSRVITEVLCGNLLDGSVYAFHNAASDRMKLLFWDGNGFTMIYKRLVGCRFKLKKMFKAVEKISYEDMDLLLSAGEPMIVSRLPALLEHQA